MSGDTSGDPDLIPLQRLKDRVGSFFQSIPHFHRDATLQDALATRVDSMVGIVLEVVFWHTNSSDPQTELININGHLNDDEDAKQITGALSLISSLPR